MSSWSMIGYGAAVSALLAALVAGVGGTGASTAGVNVHGIRRLRGPLVWNAILRAPHADQFFYDAPVVVFPVSWQDTGSGVFTVAVCALVLGVGPLRAEPGRRAALLAAVAGLCALVVDVYLY